MNFRKGTNYTSLFPDLLLDALEDHCWGSSTLNHCFASRGKSSCLIFIWLEIIYFSKMAERVWYLFVFTYLIFIGLLVVHLMKLLTDCQLRLHVWTCSSFHHIGGLSIGISQFPMLKFSIIIAFSMTCFWCSKEQLETKLMYAISAEAGFDLSWWKLCILIVHILPWLHFLGIRFRLYPC